MKPSSSCTSPASTPSRISSSTLISGATPWLVSSIAKAESTAAAGAQGALMRRSVPPSVEATRPITVAPIMPASAPMAA